MQTEELRLVLEAVSGHTASFDELTKRYSPTILGLAYSLVGNLETARDISQETFLKAYVSLATLHHPERFGSWLRQIAANLAKSHLRQRHHRHEPLPESDKEQSMIGADLSMEVRLDQTHLKEEILRCLQAIPEGPRTAVVMHYLIGLTPVEGALRLGISRAAFDTRLSRGRELLRKELSMLLDEALHEQKQHVTVYLEAISKQVQRALGEGERERATAAKELALLAARANLPRLMADLQSHDLTTRLGAARLLGDLADRRASAALLQRLQGEDETPVQAELCRTLARVGVVEAIPALKHLSRQTAVIAVHAAAAEAVKSLEDMPPTNEPEDIPVEIDDLKAAGIESLFLELLGDESAGVKVHAIDGLGRVESTKALPHLLEALRHDEQDYVRRAAAEALASVVGPGRTRTERITPAQQARVVTALADMLDDASPGVVAEAGWSLALMGGGDDEKLNRYVLEKLSLESLIHRRPGPWWGTFPRLLEAYGQEADMIQLLQLLLEHRDTLNRGPITEGVARMARPGQSAVIPYIIDTIEAGLAGGQGAKALGQIHDDSVIPFLQKCLSPTASFPVQLHPRIKFNEQQLTLFLRKEAAQAIIGFPGGLTLLKEALQEWPARDEQTLMALITVLESACTPGDAPFLRDLGQNQAVPVRVQMRARAAARRLTLKD